MDATKEEHRVFPIDGNQALRGVSIEELSRLTPEIQNACFSDGFKVVGTVSTLFISVIVLSRTTKGESGHL